jgi:cytochrome c biogenesis protein CcmG, thiol:disulfide interchange protein DsbE
VSVTPVATMKPVRRPLIFVLPLLLLAVTVFPLLHCGKDRSGFSIGETIPDFRLDTTEHQRFYLNQHNGKVVVLIFWATWCRSCKKAMLDLEAFTRLPEWQNVVVAAVCNDPENADDVKGIVKHLDLTYPILKDDSAHLSRKLKISALPTLFIIDQKQVLRFTRVGYDPATMAQVKSKVILLKEEGNN